MPPVLLVVAIVLPPTTALVNVNEELLEVVSRKFGMSLVVLRLPFSNTSNWYVVPVGGGGTKT